MHQIAPQHMVRALSVAACKTAHIFIANSHLAVFSLAYSLHSK